MQCVRSKRAPVATSPSIGTAAFAWKSGWSFMDRLAEEGEVVRSATPAGLVAWTTHLGPYSGLGAAHDSVRQWCRANNRQLAGPNWEIYGHWQSEWNTNPSQIQIDVYYLLTS
jgi:effector-binding domain-containing protein